MNFRVANLFQIWTFYPTLCIALSIAIFPFILNGYYWLNVDCRFVPWSMKNNCDQFYFNNSMITSIANIAIGVITFSMIIFAVVHSRKNYGASSSNTAKAERNLISQTLVSSFFLILFHVTFVLSAKFMSYPYIFIIIQYLSNAFFFLHHYPGIFLLFCVSQVFRDRFAKFYRLNAILKLLKVRNFIKIKKLGSVNVY